MLKAFETEHFFARYEFKAPYLLSVSDCETLAIEELLQMAGVSLNDLAKLTLGYTESQGNPSLRAAIASSYQTITAKDVLVLNSPIEGIYLTMRALLEPTDEAIVLTPAYDALLNLPESLCAKVKRWELEPTPSSWRLNLEKLEVLISPQTKLLVVNFPHNPTGFLPDLAQFQTLIELAVQHKLWLFSDEMYRGLELERPRLPSAIELYDKAVVLSGLSKTQGLPGLRAGWLLLADQTVQERLLNWKMYTSICPPAPTEFLAEIALAVADQLAEKNRAIIRQNVKLAASFFEQDSFFNWRPPHAGSVALVGLAEGSATDYCHQLAQEAGIVLLPSSFLGYVDNYVRFGFGRKAFKVALEAYKRYLSQG